MTQHRFTTRKIPRTAPMVTAFRWVTGIYHSRCCRRIEYRGACGLGLNAREGVELDFYCRACGEHVTLPTEILSRIPWRRPPHEDTRELSTH